MLTSWRSLQPILILLACTTIAACRDSSGTTARCGDGHVDPGEQCDDGNATGGDGCSAACQLETAPGCGDGSKSATEECDGADLGGKSCADFGYYGGTLACNACHLDVTSCTGTCGDGVLNGDETCDDADFGGDTCADHGFYGGTLGCSADCQTLSFGSCAGECGDGTSNGGEACDATDFAGDTCANHGFYRGTLTCSADCGTVTTESCAGYCGDLTVDDGEGCDDGNTVGADGCSAACRIETADCGNGTLDAGEECDDGNDLDGDGCQTDCTRTPVGTVVFCQTLAPLASGTCSVTAGDGGRLIKGDVLTPTAVFRGGQVLVDTAGKIVQVGCPAGCDAACLAKAATATVITCPKGVITPGLINTHDHITFTQNNPYTQTAERYEHRHEWRKGSNGHTKIPAPGSATADQVSWGELRFLFGGATSTIGSGGRTGLLRNLDRATMEEGLNQTAVNFSTFPLDDSGGTMITSGCAYGAAMVTPGDIGADDAYLPHVSEGIGAAAQNEFVCLSDANPAHNVLVDKSAYIHGVGLRANDYANMARNGTSLIWSPRSNITLYGNTAEVTIAGRLGVSIALGTDWMPTGSMNLLRELQCADSFNQKYLAHWFTDRDLWLMVTANAAVAAATDDVIGVLAAGKVADIAVFDGSVHHDYRAIIDAQPQDVALVMRAGKVLYGEATAVATIPNTGACDTIDVCGAAKAVCLTAEIGKTYPTLKTSLGTIYPTFFCGVPTNEPSCTPARGAAVNGSTTYSGAITVTDSDGDGIGDAQDNCPHVFNPIRPMDNGHQADFDADGVGDVCDVCPLDANTMTCSTYDPNDRDGDGIPNATDKCPNTADPDQVDADSDGIGDLCDACPSTPNVGSACPVTIYDVKQGTAAVGSTIALINKLVTARTTKGYYLQEKTGDPGYNGTDWSGVFVYDSANTVKAGDRVTITSAVITNWYSQIELTKPAAAVVTSLNEAAPAPVVVAPADVATGGAKAAALESVLVQVANVTVTSITPALGSGDSAPSNEFVVTGGLRVNDYLYLIDPFPAVDTNYATLTGVLDFRNDNSKLEPRGPGDVAAGTATLIGFGPGQTYVDVGAAGVPTFPAPLTVQLSNAVATDTFVAVTSADELSLTVVGGGVTIPAGQTSAPVLVNGLLQAANVQLTATLDTAHPTANVRVLGAAEVPVLADLTPGGATAAPGGTVTFTVTLDLPAPTGGTTVALAVDPATAGSFPATVTVPAHQLAATFDYVDANVVTSASVTATLAAVTKTATVTIAEATGGLIINEIDYDMPGAGDSKEYVEIYNGGGAAVSLVGVKLVSVNGANSTPYRTVDLTALGAIDAGQYLVVGASSVVAGLPAEVLKIDAGAVTDYLQNGAPDGLVLVDTVNHTVLDALSYEGSITAVAIADITGTISLVEGTATTAKDDGNAGALCRIPNGVDTNDAAHDWKLCAAPTPGVANVE